jgi:site-specific recombinase XerD
LIMRPRKSNRHLPKSVYERRGAYYYVKGGVWEPLGRDLSKALAKYGDMHSPKPEGVLDGTIDAGMRVILRPGLAPSTKVAYGAAAKWIKRLFRKLTDIQQIGSKEVRTAKRLLADKPVMANRVIVVLRELFEYWAEQGIVSDNPARMVPKYTIARRTRLITPQEYNAIYEKATEDLQIIMDLWRLTGQRVMDAALIKRVDLLEEGIYFRQAKTGAELIVRWNPELKAVVDRAKGRHGNVTALTLIPRRGEPLKYNHVNRMWLSASRGAQVEDVQARDLRAMALTAIKQQKGKAAAQGLGGHKRETTTEIYLRDREISVVDGPSFGQVLDIQNRRVKNQ